MERSGDRWPSPWRLEFVWQRITIGLTLAAATNLTLAIVGVDAARHSSAVISIVVLTGLVLRLAEWIARDGLPKPRRRGLPPTAWAFEFLMIGVVAGLWVATGLLARPTSEGDGSVPTALAITAIGLPLLMLSVQPRASWSVFRSAEPQRESDDEIPATARAVATLLGLAVVLPGVWWLLVEYVYGGDEFDRVLVPIVIAAGFVAWAFVKNQDRLDERRRARSITPSPD